MRKDSWGEVKERIAEYMQNEYEIKGNHFKEWVTRAGVGDYYFFNWQVK